MARMKGGKDAQKARAARKVANARYQEKLRGGPARDPVLCPSYPAARRHERDVAAGKPSDCTDPKGCKDAYNTYHRDARARRTATS